MCMSHEGKANRILELPTLCILRLAPGPPLLTSVSPKIINFVQIRHRERTLELQGVVDVGHDAD